MASSSNNYIGRKYDVFLNFRGADTRNNFTSHLYHALSNKGIHTFMDDQLPRGKLISPALLEVIESSRISILVFSPDYASSTYCLDELVKILECQHLNGQIVVPVFYKVSPEEVETQTGKYGEAFSTHTHESMEDTKKVKDWKAALSKATSFAGRHLDNGHEADFIQRIVAELYNMLDMKLLPVADHPVGLVYHVGVMNEMLSIDSNDVRMVGIHGTGGIGKTTIAKAIFNRFSYQFEGSCFLAIVRETSKQYGVAKLQEKLLVEMLRDKIELVGDCDWGITLLKRRLCSKRVLIVIDDADDVDQLKKLAGAEDWFAPGSRIIITTRDERLLISRRVQIVHHVKGLEDKDALELFSWNAFNKPQPEENYAELCHCFLKYAGGLPLALIVLGSDLYGRSIPQWKSYLHKLKRIPNPQISEILSISFDGLEDNEKAIFLDIACFFKGGYKDDVMEFLTACDFEPAWGIPVLIEKSLISIANGQLQMHDLIQSMGWEIVDKESPKAPGKRSRLWRHEDVFHLLTEHMGTHKIEAIMLDLPKGYAEIDLPTEAFAKMKKLRMLIIRNARITRDIRTLPNELRWLEWPGCPLKSLSFMFGARNLVVLKMPNSLTKQLGVGLKNLKNLVSMDFTDCKFLTEIPDLSTNPSLKKMDFSGCTRLVKVHPSIGLLEKLNFLSFSCCSNLKSLPSSFKLESLEVLWLDSTKIEKLPNFKNLMKNLKKMYCCDCKFLKETNDLSNAPSLQWLDLGGCISLAKIHPSIGFLGKLVYLSFSGCTNLKSLPPSCFEVLESLKALYVSGTKLEKLPDFKNSMKNLEYMYCRGCKFLMETPDLSTAPSLLDLDLEGCTSLTKIHPSVAFLEKLENLRFRGCTNLKSLPSCFKLRSLQKFTVDDCTNLEEPSTFMEYMTYLVTLDLSGSAIKEFPSSIEFPPRLESLALRNCKNLISLPSSIYELPSLEELILDGCPQLSKFLENTTIPSQSTVSSSRLSRLSMANCNLSDLEFLNRPYFSQLSELNLSGSNNFVSLPSRISEFTKLRTLILSGCQRLQEIPKLPGIIQVEAKNCISLQRFPQLTHIFQCWAYDRLVLDFSNCHKLAASQGIDLEHDPCFQNRSYVEEFDFFFPGSEIPLWFNYTSDGGSMSFQLHSSPVYGRIKGVILCLIIAPDAVDSNVPIRVSIELRLRPIAIPLSFVWSFELESVHMRFYCFSGRSFANLLNNSDSVRIQCAARNGTVKKYGAYVVLEQNDDHSESKDDSERERDGSASSDSDQSESERENDEVGSVLSDELTQNKDELGSKED